jgi:hypothetical protein
MIEIRNQADFANALRALSISQQRRVGARFVANVLDLTDAPRLAIAQQVAAAPDATAETLTDAYHPVHAVSVQTHPRSDLTELDYGKQAAHFIAEALLMCLAPTYPEVKVHHIAEKAAMYCRMARMCAKIPHGDLGEGGSFAGAEAALKREIEDQYAIVSGFVGE